jgi:sensor histidine kinase regulating citrate/malate metabolism
MLAAFQEEYQVKANAISASESVSKMIAVIDALDQQKATKGVNNYDGTIRPW